MTDKQVEKVKRKIDQCKKALAADKKFWGGEYHDGRGIRYYLPELYLKIKDYRGGLRYLNWFDKNFPDDSGFPEFLFESTFIFFKCDRLKAAEIKARRTFYSDILLFDTFLERQILNNEMTENSNLSVIKLNDKFKYSRHDIEFNDFAKWLEEVLSNSTFLKFAKEFIQIERQLKNEPVGKIRTQLVNRSYEIKYGKI